MIGSACTRDKRLLLICGSLSSPEFDVVSTIVSTPGWPDSFLTRDPKQFPIESDEDDEDEQDEQGGLSLASWLLSDRDEPRGADNRSASLCALPENSK